NRAELVRRKLHIHFHRHGCRRLVGKSIDDVPEIGCLMAGVAEGGRGLEIRVERCDVLIDDVLRQRRQGALLKPFSAATRPGRVFSATSWISGISFNW